MQGAGCGGGYVKAESVQVAGVVAPQEGLTGCGWIRGHRAHL